MSTPCSAQDNSGGEQPVSHLLATTKKRAVEACEVVFRVAILLLSEAIIASMALLAWTGINWLLSLFGIEEAQPVFTLISWFGRALVVVAVATHLMGTIYTDATEVVILHKKFWAAVRTPLGPPFTSVDATTPVNLSIEKVRTTVEDGSSPLLREPSPKDAPPGLREETVAEDKP